ncbi:probable protein phosphatase 2C 80 [Typha latifolia]|uniref:probable protein phosphatase 2C 80 n=1 Tax=Typha latifolia TaxID=4733 RepID=UPI003C2F2C0D
MQWPYLLGQKALQFSSDFVLGRRSCGFSLGSHGIFQSRPFSTLLDNLSLFQISDQQTALSLSRKFSRAFSINRFPCLASHPTINLGDGKLFSECIRRSPCMLFQRNATCTSLPDGTHSVGHDLDFSYFEDLQIVMPVRNANVCYHSTNLGNFSKISSSLKNREVWGSNVIYKCFWANASGKNIRSNSVTEQLNKEFLLTWSASYSAGADHDVSFNGPPSEACDQQLENSVHSSDQNMLGDRTLKLLSGSCYLPHPEKEETGGEDAHFICDEQAIGVADGVGGWADLGVDSGQYARELMSHSITAIQEEPKGSIDPARVLEKAYKSTKAKGSSTACIIALTDQGIRAVNLGDSGFMVVRDGHTIFRSPVQQHDFNFTYQLESDNSSDLPSSAQVFTFPVASGDVIIAGTDGLFDNLYNNEITAVVVHAVRAGLEPQVTAQKIAALARQRALDKNRQTPFSSAAQDAGYRYYGGKLDDITVVVSHITAFGT